MSNKLVNVDKLVSGEWIMTKRYMCFDKKLDDKAQVLINHEGKSVRMTNNLIENWCVSASQYETEKKVSRTEMALALHNAKNSPFTVVFKKLTGENRTLVGYLINSDELMGRAKVVDLDIKDKNNQRLVDYRTLESLILDGVKYILK